MKTKAFAQSAGPAYEVQEVTTKSGDTVCVFKIKTWKTLASGEEKKEHWKVVAFSSAAKALLNILTDGKFIIVDGDMDTYTEGGEKKFQVKLREFFLVDTKKVV